ncbi:unnamed protein product [Phyllotreta striolata]|uniref:Major facilitator superfamily (MFS) profile domain-containing protein n=1 Tax=Phyllotreta striolata TaxID=444603 RepID=A0A9N9TRW0_PHYSR|nr:unnamed protein product [Phyllotreta striolata]
MRSEGFYASNSLSYKIKSYGRNWFVYFCTFTCDLLGVTYGFSTSWPSSIIPKLQSNNTEVNPLSAPITPIETATLAALPLVFNTIGIIALLVTSKISDKIGRKMSLICAAAVICLCYLILAFAKYISIYFLCLALIGLCDGVITINLAAYNSEIAQDSNRGKVMCFQGLCVPIGNTVAYFAGFTNVKTIAGIGIICPMSFLCLSYFLTESPVFLVSNEARCKKALERLRGTKDVEMEFLTIKKSKDDFRKFTIFDIFKSRASIKSFALSVELFSAEIASGAFLLTAFMAPIFDDSRSYVSGNSIGVISGGIQIVFVFFVSFLVERLGRKPLLLFSSIFVVLNLFCLGVYFYLINNDILVNGEYGWIPLFLVVSYYMVYSVGLGPIPFTMTCELFSHDLKKIGISAVMIVTNIQVFIVLFSFPLITEAIGVHFCLWLYCLLSIFAFVAIYITIPETKGKCMSEIQDNLARH